MPCGRPEGPSAPQARSRPRTRRCDGCRRTSSPGFRARRSGSPQEQPAACRGRERGARGHPSGPSRNVSPETAVSGTARRRPQSPEYRPVFGLPASLPGGPGVAPFAGGTAREGPLALFAAATLGGFGPLALAFGGGRSFLALGHLALLADELGLFLDCLFLLDLGGSRDRGDDDLFEVADDLD